MNWITRYKVFNEQTSTGKSNRNIMLLLLAALGIMLIGLTITNVPIVYSEDGSGNGGDKGNGNDGNGGDKGNGCAKGKGDGSGDGGSTGHTSGTTVDKLKPQKEKGKNTVVGTETTVDKLKPQKEKGGFGKTMKQMIEDEKRSAYINYQGEHSTDDIKQDESSQPSLSVLPGPPDQSATTEGGTPKDKSSGDVGSTGDGANGRGANGGTVNGLKDFQLLQARAGLTAMLTAAKAFGYEIPTPGPDKPATPSSDTKTYTNTPYGLIANYPSKWRIDETDSDPNDGVLEFAHIFPSASSDQKVEIGIDDKPTDKTLIAYLKSTTDIRQSIFGGINVLELNTNIKVAGKPAYKIVFTLKDKSTETMEMGFIVGGKVYHITYTAKPETYHSYLPEVQSIANSLRIDR